jgi:indole-3-glycerol phosphate synthase
MVQNEPGRLMANLLDKICEAKRHSLEAQRKEVPLTALKKAAASMAKPRGFIQSLKTARAAGRFGLICEIKRASPSAGRLHQQLDVGALACSYAKGGAACLSVVTEHAYFAGLDEDLMTARAATQLPVLRKDFVLDPYQVAESRALGADCILLILSVLEPLEASELEVQAHEFGLDVLLEVHNEAELVTALSMESPLIGINNRNLQTLEVDHGVSRRLAHLIPDHKLIVSESGLKTRDELIDLEKSGIGCFLIGESLLRQHDAEAATRALLRDAVHGKAVPLG